VLTFIGPKVRAREDFPVTALDFPDLEAKIKG
jgi:hypothetical protein